MSRSWGRAPSPAPTPSSTTSQEAGAAHWLGPARGGAYRVGGDWSCGPEEAWAPAATLRAGSRRSLFLRVSLLLRAQPLACPVGWARRRRGPDRKLRMLAGQSREVVCPGDKLRPPGRVSPAARPERKRDETWSARGGRAIAGSPPLLEQAVPPTLPSPRSACVCCNVDSFAFLRCALNGLFRSWARSVRS